MTITATLSLVALLGVAGWKVEQTFYGNSNNLNVIASSANASSGIGNASGNIGNTGIGTSSPQASQIGPAVVEALMNNYFAMKQQGTYTAANAQQVGAAMAPNIHTQIQFTGFTASQLKTDPDISYAGMMKYRAALHDSLAPLLKNGRPELDLYGEYIDTHDTTYLAQLKTASQNYKDAVALTAKILVPQDAVQIHIKILNSLQEFATVLDVMIANSEDPITSAVLLQNYNEGEDAVRSAFADLITYEKSKHA